MPSDMDQTDRKLLNIIQSSFPMSEQPFDEIGEEMSIPAQEVLDRIADAKEKNVVRQISAIFTLLATSKIKMVHL